jgi:ubiquinone biosynthesis protein COQ4
MSASPFKNRPLVALRALMVLANDPDDLPKVFTVIESLPGRSPLRTMRLMRASVEGRELLATRPDLKRRLSDRDALRKLPEGSLGRAYLDLVERAGITPEGIVDASEKGSIAGEEEDAEMIWMGDRMRDTHDLWHAVTGYQTDLLGEVALLAFSYAQTKHPGIALVSSLALIRSVPKARELMIGGYKRGKKAAWLPSVQWEKLLDRPLDEVRTLLDIEVAPDYEPLTSATLREEGVLAPRAA